MTDIDLKARVAVLEAAYTFLELGDVIEPGDECPSDDCSRWESVNRWAIGSKRSAVFKIIRRRIPAREALRSTAPAEGRVETAAPQSAALETLQAAIVEKDANIERLQKELSDWKLWSAPGQMNGR